MCEAFFPFFSFPFCFILKGMKILQLTKKDFRYKSAIVEKQKKANVYVLAAGGVIHFRRLV